MNNRRRLVIALGASALGVSLQAIAEAPKIYRIGILSTRHGPYAQEFRDELQTLGYAVGQNISFLTRFTERQLERFPALAAELVAEKVDVILAPSTPAAQAAQKATSTIPIVFLNVTDPVGSGFVKSLAQPGYNMTGLSHINAELAAKRLEILKDFFPKASRVAVLTSGEPIERPQLEQVQIGAKALGIKLEMAQVLRREDFESVSKRLRGWRANAILVIDSLTNSYNGKLLADFAGQVKLPTMSARNTYTDDGLLISYGANGGAMYRRAAHFVDKILKGAKPTDLPAELPTRYELVINLKTAKALGIKFPHSLLQRADRVIE